MATKKNKGSKAKAAKGDEQAENGATEPAKRKGRAPSEGEPLKRVLIFLGPKEIEGLKGELEGDRGLSKKIREIVKQHLER